MDGLGRGIDSILFVSSLLLIFGERKGREGGRFFFVVEWMGG